MNGIMKYKYDLAISLMSSDVEIGWNIVNSLDNPDKIFFYEKDVDKLTFNNGVNVFGDVFSTQSRFVLVLYREGYGKTDWTALEYSIIQDRFKKTIKNRNSPILFCKLDDCKNPNWLPETYIYCSISPLDNLINVLRKRINDLGGILSPQTVEERFKLNLEKKKYEETFMDKVFMCQKLADNARFEASNLRDKLLGLLKKKSHENGLFFDETPTHKKSNIPLAFLNVNVDKLNLILRDNQTATNSIYGAFVEIVIINDNITLRSYKKKFYITINGIKGWRNIDDSDFVSTVGLTEIIFQDIILILSQIDDKFFDQ